jgi:hypothetical protein
MKRTISSINNNRDVNSSQSKRLRPNTAVLREEVLVQNMHNESTPLSSQKKVGKVTSQNMHNESTALSSQKKVGKVTSQNTKQNKIADYINDDTHSNVSTSTPSRSSISFSSSSLSKFNGKAGCTPSSSSQLQEKILPSERGTVNVSKLSQNK